MCFFRSSTAVRPPAAGAPVVVTGASGAAPARRRARPGRDPPAAPPRLGLAPVGRLDCRGPPRVLFLRYPPRRRGLCGSEHGLGWGECRGRLGRGEKQQWLPEAAPRPRGDGGDGGRGALLPQARPRHQLSHGQPEPRRMEALIVVVSVFGGQSAVSGRRGFH